MEIRLFDLKNMMVRDGIEMVDFVSQNFLPNYFDSALQIKALIVVQERHLGRIDLISTEAYNSADYVDVIQKFNQICNPFSMELNQFVVCPDIASADRFYRTDPKKEDQIIKDTKALFIDPSRASQKDLERLKQLEKIAQKRKNGSKEIKPTNLLREGEVPFVADGTAVRFSPSNSKARPTINDL
jgi:hypothetical protein